VAATLLLARAPYAGIAQRLGVKGQGARRTDPYHGQASPGGKGRCRRRSAPRHPRPRRLRPHVSRIAPGAVRPQLFRARRARRRRGCAARSVQISPAKMRCPFAIDGARRWRVRGAGPISGGCAIDLKRVGAADRRMRRLIREIGRIRISSSASAFIHTHPFVRAAPLYA